MAARDRRSRARRSPARSSGKRATAPDREAAARSTGAEALVAQLQALGVELVFGLPGVHNLAIFDALDRAGVRVVVVRHEQTAAYAADGYARSTGRLGVCITTTGPGAANTAAALGEARAARSPVLHISTQVAMPILRGATGRFSLHESPKQRELMAGVCVWTGSVAQAEAIPSMIQRAAREAFAGRRGPTFVEIPHDLLDEPVTWEAREPLGAVRSRPDERTIERAASVLNDAKRPIIWAGGGAISAGAADRVLAAAEAMRAPVVTTFAGKGIVPPDHPLAVGLPPHEPAVTKLIASSDAVLIVGSDLDAMNTQGWRVPLPRPRVSINTVAEDARRNYAADVVLEFDAAVALEALLPALTAGSRRTGAQRVARAREAVEAATKEDAGAARAARFIARLAAAVGDEAIVFADMCIPGYWAAARWPAPGPRSFAYPLGWGTLGFALPAAIGAAAAGRPALVIAGDAGALFAIGELATAVQERLPITVLVVDDGGYGMLRYDELARFGRTIASDLVTPDFVALASAFGVDARTVGLRDAPGAVRDAMASGAPAVLALKQRFDPPVTTSPRWPLKGKPEARP